MREVGVRLYPLVQLVAVDGHVLRPRKPQFHPVPLDGQHLDFYRGANPNPFSFFSTQDQHCSTPLERTSNLLGGSQFGETDPAKPHHRNNDRPNKAGSPLLSHGCTCQNGLADPATHPTASAGRDGSENQKSWGFTFLPRDNSGRTSRSIGRLRQHLSNDPVCESVTS